MDERSEKLLRWCAGQNPDLTTNLDRMTAQDDLEFSDADRRFAENDLYNAGLIHAPRGGYFSLAEAGLTATLALQ